MEKVNIVLLTYHVDNLFISLPQLDKIPFRYDLLIHNDNPEEFLTDEKLKSYGYNRSAIIINERENQGMLKSRLAGFNASNLKSEYTIFLDDDDIFTLNKIPEFSTPKYSVAYLPVYHVRQLLCYMNRGILPDENKDIRYGISGNIYRTEPLKKYVEILEKFIGSIKNIYGTDHINTGEDDLFDGLYYILHHEKFNSSYSTYEGLVGYLWNQIESTAGRYIGDDNDFRYSSNPTDELRDQFVIKYAAAKAAFKQLIS